LKAKYHTDMAGLVDLRDRRKRELEGFRELRGGHRRSQGKLAEAFAQAAAWRTASASSAMRRAAPSTAK